MVKNIGFNLKSTATLASKRVSLSFEVLKWGIDFSPGMKFLDGIFFPYKAANIIRYQENENSKHNSISQYIYYMV